MAIHKLNPRQVATAGPGRHEDGGGLRLVVDPSGARRWVLRVTVNGRRREMGLGAYPAVGLAKARADALRFREMAKQGADPIAARAAEQAAEAAPTFTTCAARYIRAHRRGWRNRKHARQWVATLKAYARPVLGSKPVDTVATEDVLRVLSPIWTTRTETAKRVQGRIENIIDYAAAHGHRDPLNPARWRGHLDKLLPRPTKVKQARHHPAMPYATLPAFVAELAGNGSVSALALRFLILTACRTGEVLGAQWQEIDLDAAEWTVPAERMKAGREHRVPLSDAALAVLAAVPRVEGNPCVFPGARYGRPLSTMALLQLMRGMGYGVEGTRGDYVPHGFRSAFRDWAEETTGFPARVCEAALAHRIPDATVRAYARGDLFEKRRKLMDAWARFVTAAQGRKVIVGRFGPNA